MSTILKALKRLEHESGRPQGGSGGASSARRAVRQVVKPGWVRAALVKWVLVAGLLLTAAAGGYHFLLFTGSGSGNSREAAAHAVIGAVPAGSPAKSASQPAPVLPNPAVGTHPAVPRAELSGDRIRGSLAEESPAAVSEAPPAIPAPVPRKPQAAGRPIPQPKPQAPPAPVRHEAYADAERLPDGRLTIQALVWSPSAGDRMVVINDSILREGLGIDGFIIVEITREGVLVKDNGGHYWKVPFGHP